MVYTRGNAKPGIVQPLKTLLLKRGISAMTQNETVYDNFLVNYYL